MAELLRNSLCSPHNDVNDCSRETRARGPLLSFHFVKYNPRSAMTLERECTMQFPFSKPSLYWDARRSGSMITEILYSPVDIRCWRQGRRASVAWRQEEGSLSDKLRLPAPIHVQYRVLGLLLPFMLFHSLRRMWGFAYRWSCCVLRSCLVWGTYIV